MISIPVPAPALSHIDHISTWAFDAICHMLSGSQAEVATENRKAQMERLEAWLPVMQAQIKKTKGKDKKSFTMVSRVPDMSHCIVAYALARCLSGCYLHNSVSGLLRS